jgi:DNA (cytosine-5)-methyltransferase 1
MDSANVIQTIQAKTQELIVDIFAGGGGASTGIELATGRSVDIAVDFDPDAITMHKANHPHTRHFCESVWDVDPIEATDGQPVALAWFSPSCTHFSTARGKAPVDKSIRDLAWVAVRWAATVRPRVIILENVGEFKAWGPIANGAPIKEKSGDTFRSFVHTLENHGYTVDHCELRACDYGAPTIRKRFFLIARCDGEPIRWPEPTHADPNSEDAVSGKLKPWRTTAEVIDWTLPCPSIFNSSEEIRKKYGVRAVRPLTGTTMRRIARGIQKFALDSPKPFIVQIGQQGFGGNKMQYSINTPLTTIVTKTEHCLVVPYIMPNNANNVPTGVHEPVPTVTTGNRNFLTVLSLAKCDGEECRQESHEEPTSTPPNIACVADRQAPTIAFMSKYYSGGYDGKGNDLREPLNTITAHDHNAIVTVRIDKLPDNKAEQPTTETTQTCDARDYSKEVCALLAEYCGQSNAQAVKEPLPAIAGDNTSGLVTVCGEQYTISDIGLRMLSPRELFNAQGFPPDYIIDAGEDGKVITKTAQTARCGNAVPPPFAEALVRANLPELCGREISTMSDLREEMAV